MPRDKRLFITVHNGMPDHPKIEGLSDAAFRLLLRVWCRCSLYTTDGAITEAWWTKQKPKSRQELLDAGLVEPALVGGGVIVHDWDQHQLTSEDIEVLTTKKAGAGSKGAHRRWHEGRGITDADCKYCANDKPIARAKDDL
jgi:hypothetical protein